MGSPRAPRSRSGIVVGYTLDAVGSPRTPCHGRAFWACTKCAPWLVVPTAIWMSVVETPWVCSGNAVTTHWGLLKRHEDAVRTQRGRIWSPQERRCRRWRLHGGTASSRRVYGVFTAPKPNIIYPIASSRRPRRAAAAITAIPCQYHWVLRSLEGVCRALTQRSQCVICYKSEWHTFYERVAPVENFRLR